MTVLYLATYNTYLPAADWQCKVGYQIVGVGVIDAVFLHTINAVMTDRRGSEGPTVVRCLRKP